MYITLTFIKVASKFNTFSPKITFSSVQLDIKRLLVPTKINVRHLYSYKIEASALFRTANGNFDVRISDEFSAKMERITKNKLSKNTSIQMLLLYWFATNQTI